MVIAASLAALGFRVDASGEAGVLRAPDFDGAVASSKSSLSSSLVNIPACLKIKIIKSANTETSCKEIRIEPGKDDNDQELRIKLTSLQAAQLHQQGGPN